MLLNKPLFDRFIDVEFTTEELNASASRLQKVSFKTPKKGIKPNISLAMKLLPTGNASDVTLKIMNMYSSVNIAKYKNVFIRAGYTEGLYAEFNGEIKDCYVERPNPEGITIFRCVLGNITDMYATKEPVSVMLKAGTTVKKALQDICSAYKLELVMSFPTSWEGVKFTDTDFIMTHRNALEMWSDLKTTLRVISDVLSLPLLYSSVSGNKLYILTMLEGSTREKSVVLDKVTNAYVSGGQIIVNAPWLPTLQPSGLFKMDTRYLRGRIGNLQVGGDRKLFRAYSMNVGFSTVSENYMEVSATDVSVAGNWV